MVGIPVEGTPWNINSSQFIREKMIGSEAFYSIGIGLDDDARVFTLTVSITLQSQLRN